jgi:hypothetical protein
MLNKRITRSSHIEMLKAKAFRIFIRVCSLFISERLCANIKLMFSEAIIKSIITSAFPAYEFSVGANVFRLQRLKNKIIRYW